MPTKYSDKDVKAKLEDLLEHMAQGNTLREFTRMAGNPGVTTLYRWIDDDSKYAERFARAKKLGYDLVADECLRIADDGTNDLMETENGPTLDRENIQRSKLRVDTRLKLLAVWDAGRYGPRQQMELTGKDGGPVELGDTERAAKISALLAAAETRKAAAN